MGVTYGGGQFVAVGDKGTIVTSTDGYNWGSPSLVATGSLYAIAYGNGVFTAAGTLCLTSADGVAWTP